MVRVSRRAVVMYSDIRFSISATRIHARPWKAHSPLFVAPKGPMSALLGLDLLWLFYPVPVGRGEEQGAGNPPLYSPATNSCPRPAHHRPLTLARAVLMFSMFSMLLTQLLGTLLQANRI